jgi:hypothetical protein
MAMRMRQSLAQFEAAFREQTAEERFRGDRLRREAVKRSRTRRRERVRKHQTLRFVGLVLSIIATAVLVTIAMFETLARLMG